MDTASERVSRDVESSFRSKVLIRGHGRPGRLAVRLGAVFRLHTATLVLVLTSLGQAVPARQGVKPTDLEKLRQVSRQIELLAPQLDAAKLESGLAWDKLDSLRASLEGAKGSLRGEIETLIEKQASRASELELEYRRVQRLSIHLRERLSSLKNVEKLRLQLNELEMLLKGKRAELDDIERQRASKWSGLADREVELVVANRYVEVAKDLDGPMETPPLGGDKKGKKQNERVAPTESEPYLPGAIEAANLTKAKAEAEARSTPSANGQIDLTLG